MVFPEGARGGGKTWWKRYQLQRFGTGFMRLALETDTPIIPTAVIGAEDTYPSLYDFKALSSLLGTPYFPIYPQMLLGPLMGLPLPAQIDLHFGEPLRFDQGPDATDQEVLANVDVVKNAISSLIDTGLSSRRPRVDIQRRISALM